ncbi:MAG: hypothetical protein ABEH88_10320 [Halobacteriales archaeon]
MLDHIRSDFRSEDRTTMLVLGLSMAVTGSLTASGASDVGIGQVLGAAVLVCGLVVLGGTIAWGGDEQTHKST